MLYLSEVTAHTDFHTACRSTNLLCDFHEKKSPLQLVKCITNRLLFQYFPRFLWRNLQQVSSSNSNSQGFQLCPYSLGNLFHTQISRMVRNACMVKKSGRLHFVLLSKISQLCKWKFDSPDTGSRAIHNLHKETMPELTLPRFRYIILWRNLYRRLSTV